MKNIVVVLGVFAVLVGISAHEKTLASDEASNGSEEEVQTEETVDEQVPFEPMIIDRPPVSAEEWTPPDSAGTITCSGKGAAIKVEIKGNLMIGLMSFAPPKMMRRLSLGKDGRACWGSRAWSACTTQTLCFRERNGRVECLTPNDVQVVFHEVPHMRFLPQIGGYGFFDLKQWKVIGCVREGCDNFCRKGERCRKGLSCLINTD